MQSNEKVIFYNILKRNMDNLMSKSPLFYTFKDSIFQYVVNYIDPYLNAFIEDGHIDIDMTTDFAASEINTKIEQFKKEYKEKCYENKTNI